MSATSRRSGGALDASTPRSSCSGSRSASSRSVVGMVTAAVHLGAVLDGDGEQLPANPFTLSLKLANGDVAWPAAATPALVGILVARRRAGDRGRRRCTPARRGERSRVDRAASRMGRGRDLEPIGRKQAAATAKRLGVESARPGDRADRRRRPPAVSGLGGRLRRHLGPARRQDDVARRSRRSSRRPAPCW